MRALVLSKELTFENDRPQPLCAPGEVLVRVTHAGICNTDIELTKGYMGFRGILGHEFVGMIATGQENLLRDSGYSAGDRIVAEINCVSHESLSRNYFTRAQDASRTTIGIDRHDGVFADYACVPLSNLHHVPTTISDDEAVFTEPLAAACQILEQVHIKTTDQVAVIGDGKLGLLCAQVLATAGSTLTVFGKHADKLDLVHQRGIKSQLSDEWDGKREYDVVVECTGASGGFDQAHRMLRPRGTLVLKSTFEGLTPANLTAIVVDEINLIGSRCGPFSSALRLLEMKRVDVLPLISARYSLNYGLAAIQHARQRGVLKVLLDM